MLYLQNDFKTILSNPLLVNIFTFLPELQNFIWNLCYFYNRKQERKMLR